MATAADRKRWDDLRVAYATAGDAADRFERELIRKYGKRDWIPSGRQRDRLDRLEEKQHKVGRKIYDLLIRISPRGEAWMAGVPTWWVKEKLTWEDAIRPLDEPLSVVVPGAYGYPGGYVRNEPAMPERKLGRNADDINIANPENAEGGIRLWRFWFGQVGSTTVYVWEDSEESAFETAVEWLDDNDYAGHFTTITQDDLKAAAEDEGIEWNSEWSDPRWADWDDPKFLKVVEAAEADLTLIGHTTLKHGTHLVSYEWGYGEVTDPKEYESVLLVSQAEED